MAAVSAVNGCDYIELEGQAEQMKPKYHKGRHGSRYDWWTCSNCGCELTHDVGQNYCWNCGHMIMWGNPRCLTK